MTGLDRRFGPQPRTEPEATPGLLIDDTNTVYVVLPDGSRVALPGSGSGSISDITSNDASVTVANPHGPTTDLSVNFPASVTEITSDDHSVTITNPDGPIVDLSVAGGPGSPGPAPGLPFTYDDGTTDPPPASQTFITDSPGDLSAVSLLAISDTDADGNDVSQWLATMFPSGYVTSAILYAAVEDDDSQIVAFLVESLAGGSGFYQMDATYLAGVTTWPDSSTLRVWYASAGADGSNGVSPGVPFEFLPGDTPPPIAGGILSDNQGDLPSSAHLYISTLDENGNDTTGWLEAIDEIPGSTGILYLRDLTDHSVSATFSFQTVTPASGYVDVETTWLAGSTAISGGHECEVIIALGGPQGTAGAAWYDGSGPPSNELGVEGDYYLDDDTGDVYTNVGGTPTSPSFRGASWAEAGGGQLTIARPSGLVDGDFMYAFLQYVTGAPDLTMDGWDLLDSGVFTGVGGTATNWQLYTKLASSEPSSYSPSGATGFTQMTWLGYYNTDGLDQYADENVTVGTTLTSASITPSVDGTMVVVSTTEMVDSASTGSPGSPSFTPPAGFTERADNAYTSLRAGQSAADEVQSTAAPISAAFVSTVAVVSGTTGSCHVYILSLLPTLLDAWSLVANIRGPAGPRVVQAKVVADDTVVATGDGQMILCVPAEFDGLSLTAAEAYVTTVSGSGTPTIQIRNVTTANDMLSTPITIDASEFTSYTAATPPVIDGAHAGVSTADLIAVDVDDAGSGAQGLGVILTFG